MSAKVRQDQVSARHQGLASAAADLAVEGEMPSLDGATTWLNSPPLTQGDLRGRVVLVQFWTYTCINWLRTLAYVRAWAEKYRDRGLVVIGVHTPEFGFEQDLDNVRRAVHAMAIEYPVAIDSDYRVWGAFANQYWPALYFVDAEGRIRHHRFGEGDYERSEMVVQQLLAAAGTAAVPDGLVSVDATGPEAAADWTNLRSPETYLGHDRTTNFEPSDGLVQDEPHPYTAPARLWLNHWALSGDWTVSAGMVALNRPNGRIACQFHARDLHLVMGPAVRGASVRFRVLIDGRPAGAVHGSDVDPEGSGTVVDQRMYQLVRQQRPIADRRFEIEFLDPGVEAFVLTFG
jgi:thiol-disulfide isomerase/thioredoxin